MEVFTYAVENIGQIADAGVTLVLAVVLLVFLSPGPRTTTRG